MEQLSKERRTVLKKLSTDRVRRTLVRYGKVEEEVAALERDVLLEELANEWVKEEMEDGEGAVAGFGEVKSESENEGSAQSSEDGESERSEGREAKWLREELA